MNRFLFILLSLSFYFGYTQSNIGYVIYKSSLTETFEYSDSFKLNYPDEFNEIIQIDSLINSLEIGLVFNGKNSKSFFTKPIEVGANDYNSALYKINFDADYYYDSKTKIAQISKEFWFKQLLITVDLKDKWEIVYDKTKIIDGYKCFYAKYKGQYMWSPSSPDRLIYAWFTTDIPLPYGPLHYAGLPGLIVELNDDNVRFTATKIVFDNTYVSKLKPIDPKGKDELGEQTFIDTRMEIRKRAKQIMTGN